MYTEIIEDGKCKVQLVCDHPKGCQELTTVWADNHADAQVQLYDKGWRLYRSKQLCPTHARQAQLRLARAAAKAWNV